MNRAIFLDRDGVLNKAIYSKKTKKVHPPYSKKQLLLLYENIKNINFFKKKFLFFIITNQPDIKRGIQSKEFNDYINYRISRLIKITEISTCFCHESEKGCNCYKPNPGMILKIKKKWNIDLKNSFFIGDRWRDVLAGESASCKTIFIKKKYNLQDLTLCKPDYIVTNLNIINKIIPLNLN